MGWTGWREHSVDLVCPAPEPLGDADVGESQGQRGREDPLDRDVTASPWSPSPFGGGGGA